MFHGESFAKTIYNSLTGKRYLSIKQISSKTKLTNSQVSTAIHHLFKRGLVERTDDNSDFKYRKIIEKSNNKTEDQLLNSIMDIITDLNIEITKLYNREKYNDSFAECGELNGEVIYKKIKNDS